MSTRSNQLNRLGITPRFVDGRDFAGFEAAIDERTKAVFLELIGNPRLDIIDLEHNRRDRLRPRSASD